MHSLPRLLPIVLGLPFLSLSLAAQDNILVYGNSILEDSYEGYLSDVIVESGRPAPNLVTFIIGNGTTTNYVSNQGLITSSLPAGSTWDTVIIQGGTVETTTNLGDPVLFLSNMDTLASAIYAHSPQTLLLGHQTGADHPMSNRYPGDFADPATWLAFPVRAYGIAQSNITAAHPSSPPMKLAEQGTAIAETSGYANVLFENDRHHLSDMGEAWSACLHYQQIYGGSICDFNPDFSGSSPLVTRLLADGIDEQDWLRIAGWADRSRPRNLRAYPGSDSDFQMRSAVNSNRRHLCPNLTATAGDVLSIRLVSPLHSLDGFQAAIYAQTLPTGTLPNGGGTPGLILDRTLLTTWFSIPDLTAPAVTFTIPTGLAGSTIWIQAASRGPSGSSAFPTTLSDAQAISIF